MLSDRFRLKIEWNQIFYSIFAIVTDAGKLSTPSFVKLRMVISLNLA